VLLRNTWLIQRLNGGRPSMVKPVSYLDLAKEAKSRGDEKGVWRAFKQHARMMKKKKTQKLFEQLNRVR
jgi:hypothetical protein